LQLGCKPRGSSCRSNIANASCNGCTTWQELHLHIFKQSLQHKCLPVSFSLLSNYLTSSTSKLHFSNSQNIIFTTKHAHIYFFCHSKPVWCNIMAVIVQRSASLLSVSIPVLPRAAERGCWGENCPGPRGAGGPFLCVKYFRAKDKISVFFG
jgi:hypothetical protein